MGKEKKSKKSRAQKKKELLEKRRLEEELLRQQQLEEKKRQEELERQRLEEEERLRLLRLKKRKEELARLEKERDLDIDDIERNKWDLNKFLVFEKEQSEWKAHLQCNPLPDISNLQELNDFITIWSDDSSDVNNGFELLHILDLVIYDCIQQQKMSDFSYILSKLVLMIGIVHSKLDNMTSAYSRMRFSGDIFSSFCMGLWASSMSSAFRNSKIDFVSDLGISVELPKQVAMCAKMPLLMRVLQFDHSHSQLQTYLHSNDANDNRMFIGIGPVIQIELFKLHSPPINEWKGAGQWKLQKQMPRNLENIQDLIWKNDSSHLISIKFTVPANILISSVFGYFDMDKHEWIEMKNIQHEFDCETRIVSLKTSLIGCPISMIIPTSKFSFYKDWKLTPSGVERCKLSISFADSADLGEIVIEIVGGQCQLLSPKIAELADIDGKLLLPHELIRMLRVSGINLCNIHDCECNQIELKTHCEISSVAALFQITKCEWNAHESIDHSKMIIFKLRKPLTPNEEADNNGQDNEWQTIAINQEKCTPIQGLSLQTPIRELSHSTLLRCLQMHCTDDNTRDLQNTSFRFKQTIKRLCNLIRLFRV